MGRADRHSSRRRPNGRCMSNTELDVTAVSSASARPAGSATAWLRRAGRRVRQVQGRSAAARRADRGADAPSFDALVAQRHAAGRRRLLGAVVRPVPDGRARARAGRRHATPAGSSSSRSTPTRCPSSASASASARSRRWRCFSGGKEVARTTGRDAGGGDRSVRPQRHRAQSPIDSRYCDTIGRMHRPHASRRADLAAQVRRVRSRAPSVRGGRGSRGASTASGGPARLPRTTIDALRAAFARELAQALAARSRSAGRRRDDAAVSAATARFAAAVDELSRLRRLPAARRDPRVADRRRTARDPARHGC